MSVVKAFRFPASVHWAGGRRTRVSAPGTEPIDVALAPEFKGGLDGRWTPEALLVASAASCFAITLAAVAERSGVPLRVLEVAGVGHVERRDDGRFAFVAVELTVEIETEDESLAAAQQAVKDAEERCIVSLALDVPVHVRVVLPSSAGVGLA